jgi:hypothetical protein
LSALVAADTAIHLAPSLDAALYNRALALSELHLNHAAAKAFQHFLTVSPSPAWSAEARDRIRPLSQRTQQVAWKSVVPSLEQAAMRDDAAAVSEIVSRFHQESRTWGEAEFLGLWADAEINHDRNNADRYLKLAKSIATALTASTGESLLRDAVVAIEQSTGSRRQNLIQAHATYRQGRIAYSKRRFSEAAPPLETAARLFHEGKSPMALGRRVLCRERHRRREPKRRVSIEGTSPLRCGRPWLPRSGSTT